MWIIFKLYVSKNYKHITIWPVGVFKFFIQIYFLTAVLSVIESLLAHKGTNGNILIHLLLLTTFSLSHRNNVSLLHALCHWLPGPGQLPLHCVQNKRIITDVMKRPGNVCNDIILQIIALCFSFWSSSLGHIYFFLGELPNSFSH